MPFASMDNLCCVNCFFVTDIQDFVEESQSVGDCDYCGSIDVLVRNVKEVGEFILEGFFRRYEDAANQVGYCSAEGGYLLPTDTIDEILIDQEDIFSHDMGDPLPLLEDLMDPDGTPYVRRDPYGPPSGAPDEIERWDKFCNIVKSEQRFTALLKPDVPSVHDDSHPGNFLDYLAEYLSHDSVWPLQPGDKIYRARIWNKQQPPPHKDLTSPQQDRAKNSRMSPAGISFFYGALDAATCISELRPTLGESVAVAEFEVQKDLNLLDLSWEDLSSEPDKQKSIFDENYSFHWEEYIKPFLMHFVSDISKPIRPGDAQIEYTPTQVFTEFIRIRLFREPLLFPNREQERSTFRINGILFRSSLKKGGTNVALFKGPEISTEKPEDNREAWLHYKGFVMYEVTGIGVNYREVLQK